MKSVAVITGTLNCTVAAVVAVDPFKAASQITYPHPNASAPEKIVNAILSVHGGTFSQIRMRGG